MARWGTLPVMWCLGGDRVVAPVLVPPAGIPGKLRLIYYSAVSGMDLAVLNLEPGVAYDAHFVTPSSG